MASSTAGLDLDKGLPSLLILTGISLLPFKYYKGLPSLPSNINRDFPPSLQILQGIVLPPFYAYEHRVPELAPVSLPRFGL